MCQFIFISISRNKFENSETSQTPKEIIRLSKKHKQTIQGYSSELKVKLLTN